MSDRLRILVVDDDDLQRTYAQGVLGIAGYEVVTSENGAEALRLVEQQPPFDLFVIDVVMPQMSGTELARHLRQANPDAKLLYLTGFADQLFADKGTLWEGEAFIEKPTTPEALLEAVRLLIDGSLNQPPAVA